MDDASQHTDSAHDNRSLTENDKEPIEDAQTTAQEQKLPPHQVISQVTGISAAERARLRKYFAQLGEATIIEVLIRQSALIRQALKNKEIKDQTRGERYYGFLLQAAREVRDAELAISRKADHDPEMLARITEIRMERIMAAKKTRSNKKAQMIRRYYVPIKKLRDDGRSWRDISEYLKKYHKQVFCYSYLRTAFNEIEKNVEEKGFNLAQ